MPRNQGVQIAADKRRQLIASLLVRNTRITQRQIQAALAQPIEQGGMRNPRTSRPYSLGTIHKDIKAIREEWRDLRTRDAGTWIERELVIYEELELQAWRDGDLAEIRRVSEARRKLLGLDAPTKIAPTTPSGKDPYEGTVISVYEH